ncbi:ER membrane protein complex subunit 10 [Daktulosphaira vitifoliae]|uniref:ER membrane protein complex subunit 10 n=1 Tax=Daktulosphaira vitifoliae TaxID=58002 RepID=UPI0021AAF61F|nr:ER membrane protein complex subunit 10 [Daktulosphaira vitifoliae]
MFKKIICLFHFLIVVSALTNLESSYDSITDIYLEHELIPGAGFSNYSSSPVNLETRSDFTIESTISKYDFELIKKLANDNHMYKLKVTVRYLSGLKTSFLTFTRACHILGHKTIYILTLHLDHLDLPFGANLATKSDKYEDTDDRDEYKLSTTVFFRRPDSSPIPDTTTYIQKIEREREAREKGKSSNNKSMLGKYWMYILPLVIFMMIAGASNPEGARQ